MRFHTWLLRRNGRGHARWEVLSRRVHLKIDDHTVLSSPCPVFGRVRALGNVLLFVFSRRRRTAATPGRKCSLYLEVPFVLWSDHPAGVARRLDDDDMAASRILMTNAIGVAKTTIANRPIASDAPQAHSQTTLGFVPLPPPRQYRRNTPQSPVLHLPGV